MACASIQREHAPVRSVQEHEVPIKWDGTLRRRRQQGQRAQSAHRSRRRTAKAATPARPQSRPAHGSSKPITLERGVTHDPEFENVGESRSTTPAATPQSRLKNFRKDIIIELLNEHGRSRRPTRSTAAGCQRIPGAAGTRCQRECRRHRAHGDIKTKGGNAMKR